MELISLLRYIKVASGGAQRETEREREKEREEATTERHFPSCL
jgi:hypothetical protein